MTTIEHKPLTDRERYEMNRNQLLYNYERKVEQAQRLVVKLRQKRSLLEQTAKEIEALEEDHKTTLQSMEEEEAKLTDFIKHRRHFVDA